jgi:hypothetical protein
VGEPKQPRLRALALLDVVALRCDGVRPGEAFVCAEPSQQQDWRPTPSSELVRSTQGIRRQDFRHSTARPLAERRRRTSLVPAQPGRGHQLSCHE